MESNWEPHLYMTFLSKYKVREFCNSISNRSGGIPQSPPAGPQPPSRPGGVSSHRVDNPDYLSSLFLPYKQCQVKTKTVHDLITKGKITTPLPRSKVDGSLEQCTPSASVTSIVQSLQITLPTPVQSLLPLLSGAKLAIQHSRHQLMLLWMQMHECLARRREGTQYLVVN